MNQTTLEKSATHLHIPLYKKGTSVCYKFTNSTGHTITGHGIIKDIIDSLDGWICIIKGGMVREEHINA